MSLAAVFSRAIRTLPFDAWAPPWRLKDAPLNGNGARLSRRRTHPSAAMAMSSRVEGRIDQRHRQVLRVEGRNHQRHGHVLRVEGRTHATAWACPSTAMAASLATKDVPINATDTSVAAKDAPINGNGRISRVPRTHLCDGMAASLASKGRTHATACRVEGCSHQRNGYVCRVEGSHHRRHERVLSLDAGLTDENVDAHART